MAAAVVVTPANDDGDEVEIVEDFAEVLPFYVGAVLEQLGETKLSVPNRRPSTCCPATPSIPRRLSHGCSRAPT